MKRSVTQTAIGAKAFAAITAMEGLKLSAESKKRLKSIKVSGLTNNERRAEILRVSKGGR